MIFIEISVPVVHMFLSEQLNRYHLFSDNIMKLS